MIDRRNDNKAKLALMLIRYEPDGLAWSSKMAQSGVRDKPEPFEAPEHEPARWKRPRQRAFGDKVTRLRRFAFNALIALTELSER